VELLLPLVAAAVAVGVMLLSPVRAHLKIYKIFFQLRTPSLDFIDNILMCHIKR
jgi:hypothetical protein